MARKKQITLILIILSTLLLAGPGVVDIANAEPISSSIPTDFERQSVPSTLSPSDSIDDGPAQESVKWNLGWNSFDGNWFGSVEKVGVRALAAPVSDIRNQLIS